MILILITQKKGIVLTNRFAEPWKAGRLRWEPVFEVKSFVFSLKIGVAPGGKLCDTKLRVGEIFGIILAS